MAGAGLEFLKRSSSNITKLKSSVADPGCLTQKIVSKLSEHPDPDLNFLPILDLGSRGQTGTGSRIPDPQHCKKVLLVLNWKTYL